jgi:4-carboxymuconolactone decarboxylase
MAISETARKNHDKLFPGHVSTQVRRHVAANLKVGNDRGLLIGVITVLLPFIGYPRTLDALAAINEIAPAARKETR